MTEPSDRFRRHVDKVVSEIMNAASALDLLTLKRLLSRAAELHEPHEQDSAIDRRLASLDDEADLKTRNGESNGELRQLEVEVTAGDIRQNLLKLTPHIKRGMIKIGEKLTIEPLPGVNHSKRKFQRKAISYARGEKARFYVKAKVKLGDIVVLKEVAPRRWTLEKKSY